MMVGMTVVFAALSLLLGAIVLLKRILDRPPAIVEKAEPKDAEAGVKPDEPLFDDQLIAILTAAATAALGARARVYRVRFLEEEYISDHAWVHQGRAELHMSHRRKTY
jgi:Na+-transporting methylmalonyl-CoA/oxaloacetate decarboxylase gamma subunit